MADKYLIVGATYNGDGTSSAEAASAGAAGAWNDIAYLTDGTTPAYGSLAAGDTVYIRSKTGAGANANISITLAATKTLGNAAASSGNAITWVLDNGGVWSGVDGTLTINCGSTYVVSIRAFNAIVARTQYAWIIKETNAEAASKSYLGTVDFSAHGVFFDFSAANSSSGSAYGCGILCGSTGTVVMNGCKFRYANVSHNGAFGAGYNVRATLVAPEFVIDASNAFGASKSVFQLSGSGGTQYEIFGGRISGAGISSSRPLIYATAYMATIAAYGLRYPASMPLLSGTLTDKNTHYNLVGVDGNVGSAGADARGQWSSRTDGYFPVLNAQYPTSSPVGWSWWLYPSGALREMPMVMTSTKLFTDSPASKTLTVEALIATTYATLNKSTCYVVFSYVDDSTGDVKCVTTKDAAAGALESSSAAWSATTYGAVAFNKVKFSASTPTSIKSDSLISATLYIERKSAISGDIVFLDPDFGVS